MQSNPGQILFEERQSIPDQILVPMVTRCVRKDFLLRQASGTGRSGPAIKSRSNPVRGAAINSRSNPVARCRNGRCVVQPSARGGFGSAVKEPVDDDGADRNARECEHNGVRSRERSRADRRRADRRESGRVFRHEFTRIPMNHRIPAFMQFVKTTPARDVFCFPHSSRWDVHIAAPCRHPNCLPPPAATPPACRAQPRLLARVMHGSSGWLKRGARCGR